LIIINTVVLSSFAREKIKSSHKVHELSLVPPAPLKKDWMVPLGEAPRNAANFGGKTLLSRI
jgi:hypothetical protein